MKKSSLIIWSLVMIALAALMVWVIVWLRADQAARSSAIVTTKLSLPVVTQPLPEQAVSSTTPLLVSGIAPGSWYFEASFPVMVVDWDGRIIGEGHAQAQGDWMVAGPVPFTATINFTKPEYGTRGAVILKNDNPSGDPAKSQSIEIPIFFK